MKVYWANRAKDRLKLIHDYISEDSPKLALRVVDRLTARSMQLNELANSGRKVPEYQRNDVREILDRPYRIIYKIKSDRIDVLTVMHYRQILPADIEQL